MKHSKAWHRNARLLLVLRVVREVFLLLDNVLPSTWLVVWRVNHVCTYDFLTDDRVHDNSPNEMQRVREHVRYFRAALRDSPNPVPLATTKEIFPNDRYHHFLPMFHKRERFVRWKSSRQVESVAVAEEWERDPYYTWVAGN